MRYVVALLLGSLGGAIPLLAQPASPAAGQGSAQDPAASRIQAPPPVVRETLVVTASLEEEARQDLPVSVAVIDAEEIEDRQATEILELLATVPGLAVVQSGSPGKLTSVFTRGTDSDHTLVLWGGVPLNDPFFGGFDWAHLPTQGVDRVEVARGPFSALWGSDAIGGVVQVLPARLTGADLRLEGGEDGYLRGALAAGAGAGPFHLDVSGHLRRGDGRVENDSYDSDEGAVRLEWKAASGLRLGLLARLNDSEVGLPFDFAGLPSPQRRLDRESRQVAVPLSWDGGAWSVEALVAEHRTDLALRDPDDPFAASDSAARSRTARAVVTWRHGESWIAGGADWERQEAESADAFGPGLAGESQRTWAAFGQLHWAPRLAGRRWRFDLGARRDDNDAFGSETTAKAGALVELGGGARLRTSWGQGFRAPSLGDLFFPGFANPDLEPEESESWEVGLDVERPAWTASLVGFSTDLENLVLFDFARFVPINVGRARSRGVEAEAAVRGGPAELRVNATWLDAEDRATGEPLLRRPEWSASAVVFWRPGDWTLHAVGRHVGERFDVGPVELPSYAVAELGAAWRLGPRLEPYARLENAFDEEYEEAAGFPAPGRTLVGGLAVRWR